MIKEVSGNLLAADADALVNTVNTVGVMGKGIALQFKRAYPAMFEDYARAARASEIVRGRMHVWPTGAMNGPKYVINFPTKGHWRAPSRLPDIETGLVDLVRVVRELQIRSIAIPPLGAGSGGLDWRDVEPLIRRAFEAAPDVEVLLYPPGAPPRASEMPDATDLPRMTPGRAALITLMAQYSRFALSASPIEAQKLMYFLQEAGEPLRLRYSKHLYGPYADNLRHVLREIEGHYLSGYGDGSAKVTDAEPIEVLPGAEAAAERELGEAAATRERIRRVLELAEGFESMYGMELLATVHWVAKHESAATHSPEAASRLVHEWSPRKKDMFTARHVEIAWKALHDKGWIAA